jgi:hypothetical protein
VRSPVLALLHRRRRHRSRWALGCRHGAA